MRFITQFFRNRSERVHINKMLIVAAHEKILEKEDIDLLTREMKFLSYKDLTSRQEKVQNMKKTLPECGKEKFKVAYLLLTSLLKNGTLNAETERVIGTLMQVVNVPQEKACELVTYLKSNIQNGLDLEDAYMRLGYLLEKPNHV